MYPEQVIDLTVDEDEDGEEDAREVSWLKYSHGSIYCEANPLFLLIECAENLPFPLTILLANVSCIHCRSGSVVYGGHTSRETLPMEECTYLVTIIPQASTAFHNAPSQPKSRCT